MIWTPHGTLDELLANKIVAFIDVAKEKANRSTDSLTYRRSIGRSEL
jgi:hypothetical protein